MNPSGPGHPLDGHPGAPGGGRPEGFQPPPVGSFPGHRPPTPTTTEAILSLVFAIVGASSFCVPFSVAAIYFGIKARRLAREQGDPNNANGVLGLVGIIVGGLFGAFYGAIWLLYGASFVFMFVVFFVQTFRGGP